MDNIIESLPTELLTNVFENLSNDDILNMPPNWISSGLTESQAQALLRTMYISLEKSCLTRLEGIVCHPKLARHIHKFILHDERVKDITAWKYLHSLWSTQNGAMGSFANYIKVAREQISGDSSVTVKFGKYRMLLKEQQMVEERQDDVRILSKAFDLLPNLKAVSMDNSNGHRVKKPLGDAWCNNLRQTCIAKCDSYLLEVLFRAMSNSVRKVPSFRIMHNCGRRPYRSNFINFPGLVTKLPPNTIASAAQGLRSLSLRSIYYGLDQVDYHNAAREMGDSYSGLRTLHKGEGYDSTKGLAEMLSSASLLEDLTLTCLDICKLRHNMSHLPYLSLNLNSMRGLNDLQHLQKLELGHFKTRQDQFVRFLLTVAGTLTTIQLNDIVLDHGSWLSAFSELRAKCSRLESIKVSVSGLYDAGPGKDDSGSEELSSSVTARRVKFCIVSRDDQQILVWLRDGTGTNPGRRWLRL
ncbi:hypothetical protein BDR22DRAFT_975233 [Usnea florida]